MADVIQVELRVKITVATHDEPWRVRRELKDLVRQTLHTQSRNDGPIDQVLGLEVKAFDR